ncbi:hypothetical protein HGM15179_011933 [Zosterops borbonicus]|uniref:Uncharacterized protein n=1 Tax=Zosterops borbonicus TaxID=364589 RepID=A0A8K1GAR3_9PASS|nr:hypothetical protein HGM15179_011933 [Zosterops borbonicus]
MGEERRGEERRGEERRGEERRGEERRGEERRGEERRGEERRGEERLSSEGGGWKKLVSWVRGAGDQRTAFAKLLSCLHAPGQRSEEEKIEEEGGEEQEEESGRRGVLARSGDSAPGRMLRKAVTIVKNPNRLEYMSGELLREDKRNK